MMEVLVAKDLILTLDSSGYFILDTGDAGMDDGSAGDGGFDFDIGF
jgi:hypothetical protein